VTDGDWLVAGLAGEALLEIGLVGVGRDPLGQTLLERVQGRLVALLESGALVPRQRADAGDVLAQLGDPRFRADVWYLPDEPLLGFMEVPAASFLMGTLDEDIPTLKERFGKYKWYDFEREPPQHKVILPTYYIARYPVTVAQFRAFVEDSGRKLEIEDSLSGLDNHPVGRMAVSSRGGMNQTRAGPITMIRRSTAPARWGAFPGGAARMVVWIWQATCGSGARQSGRTAIGVIGMTMTWKGMLSEWCVAGRHTSARNSSAAPVAAGVTHATATGIRDSECASRRGRIRL
jgi:hypothetical protein